MLNNAWQNGRGELAEVRGTLTNIEKNVRPKPWKKKCEFCKLDVAWASFTWYWAMEFMLIL